MRRLSTALVFGVSLSGLSGCGARSADEAARDREPDASPRQAQSFINDPRWVAFGVRAPSDAGRSYEVDPMVLVAALQPFTDLAQPCGPFEVAAQGCRLSPDSATAVTAALGLQPGDVVTHVSDARAAVPAEVVDALRPEASQVEVTVERDGVASVFAYRMHERLAWRTFTGAATAASTKRMPEGGAEAQPSSLAERPRRADDAPPTTTPSRSKRPSRSRAPSKPSPSKSSPSKPSPSASDAKAVQCRNAQSCTIDGATFRRLLDDPTRLIAQGKVVPAISNDVHSGYKIKTIAPGSIFSQLGFRPNDKITHVNGVDLTDDVAALSLYLAAPSTRTFRISYLRGTTPMTKVLQVR